jgi:hypothetical protein
METVLASMRFLLSIILIIVGAICIDKGFDYRGKDLSAVLIVLTGMAILGTGCWMVLIWLTP